MLQPGLGGTSGLKGMEQEVLPPVGGLTEGDAGVIRGKVDMKEGSQTC